MSSANTSSEANRDDGCEWYFGVPFSSKRKAAVAKERELKVGDRVRTNGGFSFDPTTAVVIEVPGRYVNVRLDKIPYDDSQDEYDRLWSYDHSDLTLLQPTFASGTRVRVVRNTNRYAVGDTGTVTLSSDESVGVRMDDGRYWSFKPEDLAVVPAPWGVAPAPDCAGRNGEQACWPAKQEAKPKFKAGDVVRSKKFPGCIYTIAKAKTHFGPDRLYNGEIAYDYADNAGWDREESIELVTPANDPAMPCIVIRQVDGQPRPSSWPHVHQSAADATKEAERLASVNPGKQFDVYQRVTGRVGDVQVREVA